MAGPSSALGRILVVNAGSSSLKLRVLGPEDVVLASADLAPPRGAEDGAIVAQAVAPFGPFDAVGHRVVHGGTAFSAPVVVAGEIIDRLAALAALAPLHQPKSVAGLEALAAALPGVPQVACFDTAFHATLPAAASTYAIPLEWRERWSVRRYGFHGLSHAYASRRAAALLGRVGDPTLRVVTCHLGAGSSLAAVLGGRSVDTTMGFTPLEGLVMATRSGDVDPGLVPWLSAQGHLDASAAGNALEHASGLLGLAGSADMREVLAAASSGDGRARLALDVYAHRLRASIASMTASLGGLDALVFTGGIGERSAAVRRMAVDGMGYLGLAVDDAANDAAGERDVDVSAPGAQARSFVIPAREDVEIARQVREVLAPVA